MSIITLLHRILDARSRRGQPSSANEDTARPDIQIVSLPPSGSMSALAKALQAAHLAESKS
ncbi:hypothetical protein FZC33_25490 [Labrys sp. KNU-23]|uniref:hypothetical protein n=1 Tax=Labrys sp. KNU-23 TaxID=2789216 RepID=UPI0011EC721D|nr:hypothetical protein [Labrys sp. KNU-23]QEN89458.1 hypothetical protein FZC33_25490 [Labrys sp. KNU-23]